ncbi:hypothetical protein GCM10027059_35460 [Myceligenerans halotolerans]
MQVYFDPKPECCVPGVMVATVASRSASFASPTLASIVEVWSVTLQGSMTVWRSVGLLGLGLLVLGVATSQGWRSHDLEALGPPYIAPSVAQSIITTEDLEQVFDTPFILIAEGPPENGLYRSTSILATEFRQSLHVGAWARSWTSPDQATQVAVQVTQYRYAASMDRETPSCRPEAKKLETGPGTTAGVRHVSNGVGAACIEIFKGATRLELELVFVGVTSVDQIVDRVASAVTAVEEAIEPSVALTASETVQLPQTRAVLLRSWMIGVFIFALPVTLAPLVGDRGAWQRFGSLFVRRKVPEYQVDIEPQVRGAAVRIWAVGIARLALVVWCLRLTEELRWNGYQTLAIVLAALALSVILERRFVASTVRRHKTRATRGAAVTVTILGALGTALVLGGVVFFWYLRVTFDGVSILPGLAEWQVDRLATAIGIFSGVLLLTAPYPLAIARSMVARIRLRMAQGDGRQDQPHVLLLRSFVDDRIRMRSRRLDRASVIDQLAMRAWERFEEIEAAALSKYAPVLAVATPDEAFPPDLGAARIQLSHAEWKDRVQELTERAPFVVMTLGRTASLVWEIERLRDLGHLHKTLFVVPPVSLGERVKRLRVLSATLGIPWDLLRPRKGAPALVVCLPLASSHPIVVVGRSSDDLSYDFALEYCINELTRVDKEEMQNERRAVHTSSDPVHVEHTEIIPVGMAPKRRSWAAAIWLLPIFLNSTITLSLIPYLSGDMPGEAERRSIVPVIEGPPVTNIANLRENHAIVLLGATQVARADFEKGEVSTIGTLPVPAIDVTVDGGILYYASPGKGEVGAFNLAEGQQIWSRTLSKGVRSVLVMGDRLYVASPADARVIAMDKKRGETVKRIAVDGAAWDLAPGPNGPAAVLADTNELVTIDESLKVRERASVLRSPTQIAAWQGELVVLSAVEHRVVIADGSPVVYVPSTTAELASAGGFLVVEGHERVTILAARKEEQRLMEDGRRFLAADVERRLTAGLSTPGLVVNEAGEVAVATELGTVDKLAP